MKPAFDVVVVGAGPAGSACALRLARLGVSVAIVDKRTFPREKLCGEYVNIGAIGQLYDLGIGDDAREDATPLDGMQLFAHGEHARFAMPSTAWSIPRASLDARIRQAAIDAGAHAIKGRMTGLDPDDEGVTITCQDAGDQVHRLRARYVVGADGMQSNVARACNLTVPVRERRFALGAHYRGIDAGRWIEMYAANGEYVALNPLDAERANVVFVLQKQRLERAGKGLDDELLAFSREVTDERRLLYGVRFETSLRAIGPLAHRTTRPTCDRVLLVGDAAAFVDPFTGQGIFLALVGAREASAAIVRALSREDARAHAWDAYTRSLAARVADRRRIAAMMKLLLAAGIGARRAASALRKRPDDFAFLIRAVCGDCASGGSLRLAAAVGKALR